VLALPPDHDGSEESGPFKAGALAGEAMLRSGDVTLEEGYEPEPESFDDEDEGAVFIDTDTGEVIDPDMLDEYELIDEGDYPDAA
jgi:hypothetical protein